ncbi:hypothetical protein [Fibrella forsythiae]|uniref:Short-chain dehydrogenase n=1 Tax=Fibrella forsythiae TaxID=2817061 RepID=A0ABS3JV55_9BACT|nr:hypothetical protein [Fibrella forsythiae]MBO0953266.1 hypothetical protein [Fibrella forsythiae]
MSNLTPYTFFFEIPLYTKIKITPENNGEFLELLSFDGSIDAYNPTKKENTTYKVINYPNKDTGGGIYAYEQWSKPGVFILECVRTKERVHYAVYWNKENEIFQKYGQFPSIADFNISQIKKYDKVLSKDKLKEFTRAIGLAANGIGIGSYVYLRRIFENLVDEAFEKARLGTEFNNEVFKKMRMSEKIDYIKDFVPSFLSENKELYGILSLGIHSLNENDCLTHFEIVKVGIELILDEKLEQYERAKKIENATKRIQSLTSQITKKQ